MGIFALQSPAGGFLDEELHRFNREFDEWCVQFETLEDAQLVADTLDKKKPVNIVEITPLSYPKYFFPALKGKSSVSSNLLWVQTTVLPYVISRPRR
jgi:hypothetical protein